MKQMAMYHMAMPPHYGATHTPIMHPSIFPGPLMPPMNQLHSYPQPQGTMTDSNPSMLSHSSSLMPQASPIYAPHHPSVYINPYMGPAAPCPPASGMHAHIHSHTNSRAGGVSHMHGLAYTPPASSGIMQVPLQAPRVPHQSADFMMNHRAPLSVDEELMDQMNSLHLGYIETEDSPQKMEQREKLETVILEYLAITPHTHKFMFRQVAEVLEQSVNNLDDFSAQKAACAFDSLAQYAANLITQPWRKEFKEVKLYNGFWVHQVANNLLGAESILELMGYVCVKPKSASLNSTESSTNRISSKVYALHGVIDPDLIARLALDCMVAYCECQCLYRIKEGVIEYGLKWVQILQFRQIYIGGVEVSVRHLLFTLRQKINSNSMPLSVSGTSSSRVACSAHSPFSPEKHPALSPPPIPIRHSSSFAASSHIQKSTPTTPTNSQSSHFPMKENDRNLLSKSDSSSAIYLGNKSSEILNKFSRAVKLDNVDPCDTSMGFPPPPPKYYFGSSPEKDYDIKKGAEGPSKSSSFGAVGHGKDLVDGARSVSSGSLHVLNSSSMVPTAKLIDLDSSNEDRSYPRNAQFLIPKVLQNRPPSRSSSKSQTPLPEAPAKLEPEFSPPPSEVFQPGTLEEHLTATLNHVKNSSKKLAQKNEDVTFENWDFVFKGLEKKGYTKDIGDRGDILHEIARQKLSADISSGMIHNTNLNNKKDAKCNRPLTINQALQQFTMNDTKERVESNNITKASHARPLSKSSHSYENPKRGSFYDNLSLGFETANQDSDDEDVRPSLRKVNNSIRAESRERLDNRQMPATSAKSFSSSRSTPDVDHKTSRRSRDNVKDIREALKDFRDNLKEGKDTHRAPREELDVRGSVDNIKQVLPSLPNQSQKPWSCSACTYLNKPPQTICDMCGKSKDHAVEIKPLVSGGKQCPLCTLINGIDSELCSACGVHLEGSSTYI